MQKKLANTVEKFFEDHFDKKDKIDRNTKSIQNDQSESKELELNSPESNHSEKNFHVHSNKLSTLSLSGIESTKSADKKSHCLHRIFEAQVQLHPDFVALETSQGEKLTYHSLNVVANQIAHYLKNLSIGVEDRVALFFPRNLDFFKAMLAVLKAGACYVPMDLKYPKDRLEYICQDSAAKILLTSKAVSSLLPALSISTKIVFIEDVFQEIEVSTQKNFQNLEIENDLSSHLAYIIYTSGSTGQPKGVAIEHRNICSFIASEAQVFQITNQDRVFQGFSHAFDASLEEIWLGLNVGATLIVGDAELVAAPLELNEFLIEKKVTVWSTVPTLLSYISKNIPSIRILIVGGEVCPKELIERWSQQTRRFFNTYGPTETTVVATYKECFPGQEVNIGKPLPNYSVYVVRDNLRACDVGEEGELLIGGVGVARGYLSSAVNSKFIANPFIPHNKIHPRLYRSGDLVKMTEQGELIFLGRADSQIKIRGFRVELEEIENNLLSFSEIKQAGVVVQKRPEDGMDFLVGYISTKHENMPASETLKNHLREKLPSYMIPQFFKQLPQLPVMPSGKLDRKKLKDFPFETPKREGKVSLEGLSLEEKKILQLCQKVFSREDIQLEDDFFELGGHSLLAAQLVSSLRQDPKYAHLSIRDLYKNSRLQQLADKLVELTSISDAQSNPDATKKKPAPQQTKTLLGSLKIFFYQLTGFYTVFGMHSIDYIIPFFVFNYLHKFEDTLAGNQTSPTLLLEVIDQYILLSFGLHIVFVTLSMLMVVASKWLIIGKYKPGIYPIRSFYYWRFWLVQRIGSLYSPHDLCGTPFLAPYLRLLGAKIGKSVYLGSVNFTVYDLVKIDDGVSIGAESNLFGFTLEEGYLKIGKIHIGKNTYISPTTFIGHDVVLGENVEVAPLTYLPAGSCVPSGSRIAGSPFQKVEFPIAPVYKTAKKPISDLQKKLTNFLYIPIFIFLELIPTLASTPGVILFIHLERKYSFLAAMAASPLIGMMFVLLLHLQILLVKRFAGRIREGEYSLHSIDYLRKWYVDSLIHMSLSYTGGMFATVYTGWWLRWFGAKVGKQVEFSTAFNYLPDLLTIEDGVFVADNVCLNSSSIHNGRAVFEKIKIGKKSFIGNNAVVLGNTEIFEDSLVATQSRTPYPAESKIQKPNSMWLGSPPILMPTRENSDGPNAPVQNLYNLPKAKLFARGLIEFFRLVTPYSLFLIMGAMLYLSVRIVMELSNLTTLVVVFPFIFFAVGWIGCFVVAGSKWLLVGKYIRSERPISDNYVWRSELITALHEDFVVPFFIHFLRGTPFIIWYFRLMGSKIGKHVVMDTMDITEFDLIHVKDHAVLWECGLQTHLFEDRVMKMAEVHIGEHVSVASHTIVLYDTVIEDHAVISPLSLVMKGENLSGSCEWSGIPCARVSSGLVPQAVKSREKPPKIQISTLHLAGERESSSAEI